MVYCVSGGIFIKVEDKQGLPSVEEIGLKLNFGPETIKTTKRLIVLYKQRKEIEATTEEIVAGALYVAGIIHIVYQQKRTQLEVSKASGVSLSKISKVFNEFQNIVDKENLYSIMFPS